MAVTFSTYTIADALNIANRSMPRAVEDDNAAFVANMAIAYIWKRYDWRETMAALPPFWLQALTQDYGAPFYAVPSDFYGLREAYLVQTTSNPVTRWEMKILKNPRKEYVQGLPAEIGYVPETQSFRIYPVPPGSFCPTQYLIDGIYKMRPPLIIAANLQLTLIPWADMYLSEVVTAMQWAAAKIMHRPDAGSLLNDLNGALELMAAAEGLELGDQPIAPAESIYGQGSVSIYPGTGFNPGIF